MHTDEWTEPEVNGNLPTPRRRHACCLSEDGTRMYLTGGWIEDKEVANDLYWFEFETQTWNGPLEFVYRYDHTITMYNNKIWAFGGLSPDMDRVSELSWYDLETDAIGKVSIIPIEDPFKAARNTSGLHMYASGVTGTMLDVTTASSAIPNSESSISALDLDTLKIRSIISDCHAYFDGYTWNHMLTQGTKLILLGQPGSALDDGRLSHIFSLDLAEFGYLEATKKKADWNSTGTIAHDMFEFFNRSELCDFEITGVEGTVRPPLFHNLIPHVDNFKESKTVDACTTQLHNPRYLSNRERGSPGPAMPLTESEVDIFEKAPGRPLSHMASMVSLERSRNTAESVLGTPFSRSTSSIGMASPLSDHGGHGGGVEQSGLPTFTTSEPIKVHMMLLFARWPHFKRIMLSQMSEFHSRKLHIPEPVAWVRKLIEFMYRDSIAGCSIEEASGLLVLANLYELPRLRALCIEAISKLGISDENAVMIWQRASEADEDVIRRNAALQCLRHWGQIVRSEDFHNLPKATMIALCQEADSNAFLSSFRNEQQAETVQGEEERNLQGETRNQGVDFDEQLDDYAEDMVFERPLNNGHIENTLWR